MNNKYNIFKNHLKLIDEILEQAFFCPLHINDWLGYNFNQPALMNLNDDEFFDLFIRITITIKTIYPKLIEKHLPITWPNLISDSKIILAQVLANLHHDRPSLFHRILFSLPSLGQQKLDPENFELIEDFLHKALEEKTNLIKEAASELMVVRYRALQASGQNITKLNKNLTKIARQVLTHKEATLCRSEANLRLWMRLGNGLIEIDQKIAPAVMIETWALFCGAITGAYPEPNILNLWLPQLNFNAQKVALLSPSNHQKKHIIKVDCPYCSTKVKLRLIPKIKQLTNCKHLIYVGTNDEGHLLKVLEYFDLGKDFKMLLNSYYQTLANLDLYSTIIKDLYNMLKFQGRLKNKEVKCTTAPLTFYNLQAYFSKIPKNKSHRNK